MNPPRLPPLPGRLRQAAVPPLPLQGQAPLGGAPAAAPSPPREAPAAAEEPPPSPPSLPPPSPPGTPPSPAAPAPPPQPSSIALSPPRAHPAYTAAAATPCTLAPPAPPRAPISLKAPPLPPSLYGRLPMLPAAPQPPQVAVGGGHQMPEEDTQDEGAGAEGEEAPAVAGGAHDAVERSPQVQPSVTEAPPAASRGKVQRDPTLPTSPMSQTSEPLSVVSADHGSSNMIAIYIARLRDDPLLPVQYKESLARYVLETDPNRPKLHELAREMLCDKYVPVALNSKILKVLREADGERTLEGAAKILVTENKSKAPVHFTETDDLENETARHRYRMLNRTLEEEERSRAPTGKSFGVFPPDNAFRRECHRVAFHKATNIVVSLLIVLNIVSFLVLDPEELRGDKEKGGLARAVTIFDAVASGVYLIDYLLKMVAIGVVRGKTTLFGRPYGPWFILDFTMILLSVVFMLFVSGPAAVKVMRAFRAVRFLRLMNQGVRMIVNTLVQSLHLIEDSICTLAVSLVVWSILGHRLFNGVLHQRCVLECDPDAGFIPWAVGDDADAAFVFGNASATVTTADGLPPTSWNATPPALAACNATVEAYPPVYCNLGSTSCPANMRCAYLDNHAYPFIYANFDNAGSAFLLIFHVLTFSDWGDLLAAFNSAYEGWEIIPAMYFIFIVAFMAWLLINIFVAVINTVFSRVRGIEERSAFGDLDTFITFGQRLNALFLRCIRRGERAVADVAAAVNHRRTVASGTTVEDCASRVKRFTDSNAFEITVNTLIFVNLCIQCSNHRGRSDEHAQVLEISEHIFAGLFTLEIVLRIIAARSLATFLEDRWNCFDLLLAVLSLIALYALDRNVAFLRSFRVFRFVKLVQKSGRHTYLSGLKNIVENALNALVPALNTSFLFIFGILIFTGLGRYTLAGEKNPETMRKKFRETFDTVPDALLSLFIVTTADGWYEAAYHYMDEVGASVAVFYVAYYAWSAWVMLSLFTTVVLEAFEASEEEKRQRIKELKLAGIMRLKKLGDRGGLALGNGADGAAHVGGQEKVNRGRWRRAMKTAVRQSPLTVPADRPSPTTPAVPMPERVPPPADAGGAAPAPLDGFVAFDSSASLDVRPGTLAAPTARKRPSFCLDGLDGLPEGGPAPGGAAVAQSPMRPLRISAIAPEASFHSPRLPTPHLLGYDTAATATPTPTREGPQLSPDSIDRPLAATHTESVRWVVSETATSPVTSVAPGSFAGSPVQRRRRSSRLVRTGPHGSVSSVGSRTPGHTAASSTRHGSCYRNTLGMLHHDERSTTAIKDAELEAYFDPDTLDVRWERDPQAPIVDLSRSVRLGGLAVSVADSGRSWRVKYSLYLFPPNSRLRAALTTVVNSKRFEVAIFVLIMMSCVTAVVETYLTPVSAVVEDDSRSSPRAIFVLEWFVVSMFTLEFVLKTVAQGFILGQGAYLKDPWNIFDFVLLVLMFEFFQGAKAVRILRCFRPLRLVRRMQRIRNIMYALWKTIPMLCMVIVVMLYVIGLFGLVGVELFMGKLDECNDLPMSRAECVGEFITPTRGILVPRVWQTPKLNFDNMLAATNALTQVASLSSWKGLMYRAIDITAMNEAPSLNNNRSYAIFFIVFIFVGTFYLVNIFIGVIVMSIRTEENVDLLTDDQRNWRLLRTQVLKVRPKRNVRVPTNPIRSVAWRAVKSRRMVELYPVCLVLFIVVSLAMHSNHPGWLTDVDGYLRVVLLVALAGDVGCRMLAYGGFFFYTNWRIFDLAMLGSLSLVYVLRYSGNDTLYGNVMLASMQGLLEVARLLRLIKYTKGVRLLLQTLWTSFVPLFNCILLLLLFLFIWGLSGHSLFGRVRDQQYVSDAANFRTFHGSLLMLFKFVTLDQWNDTMLDCLIQEPLCTNDGVINDCGPPKAVTYVFFYSFFFIGSCVLYNLLIGIIIDEFAMCYSTRFFSIRPSHIDEFLLLWAEEDADHEGGLPRWRLLNLVKKLEQRGNPLGFSTRAAAFQLLLFHMDLHEQYLTAHADLGSPSRASAASTGLSPRSRKILQRTQRRESATSLAAPFRFSSVLLLLCTLRVPDSALMDDERALRKRIKMRAFYLYMKSKAVAHVHAYVVMCRIEQRNPLMAARLQHTRDHTRVAGLEMTRKEQDAALRRVAAFPDRAELRDVYAKVDADVSDEVLREFVRSDTCPPTDTVEEASPTESEWSLKKCKTF